MSGYCQADNTPHLRFTPHHLQIRPEVKIFRARPSHSQVWSEMFVACAMSVMLPLPVSGTNPWLILTTLVLVPSQQMASLCHPFGHCNFATQWSPVSSPPWLWLTQFANFTAPPMCHRSLSPIMCRSCPHNSNLINSCHPGSVTQSTVWISWIVNTHM